jgi:FtsZ-interacting cell division protein ZipA
MDPVYLKSHWALFGAAGIAVLIGLIVVYHLIMRSAWGQFREMLRGLAKARRTRAKAQSRFENARRTATRLQEKSDRVKPRRLKESKEAVEDTRALLKIAHDKVQIAENNLRLVIQQEYAPVKQQRLRRKYKLDQDPDQKPFSF